MTMSCDVLSMGLVIKTSFTSKYLPEIRVRAGRWFQCIAF